MKTRKFKGISILCALLIFSQLFALAGCAPRRSNVYMERMGKEAAKWAENYDHGNPPSLTVSLQEIMRKILFPSAIRKRSTMYLTLFPILPSKRKRMKVRIEPPTPLPLQVRTVPSKASPYVVMTACFLTRRSITPQELTTY